MKLLCLLLCIMVLDSSHPLLELLDFADSMPKAAMKAFDALGSISKKRGKAGVAEKLNTFKKTFLTEERFGFTKTSIAGLIKEQLKENAGMFEGFLRKNPKIAVLMDGNEGMLEEVLTKFITELMKVWDVEMLAEGPLMKGFEAIREILNSKAAEDKIPETIRAKMPKIRQTIEHLTHMMKQNYAGDEEMQEVAEVISTLADDDEVIIDFLTYLFENLGDTLHWLLNSNKNQLDFAQLTERMKSEL